MSSKPESSDSSTDSATSAPAPSFVKQAMRNMVRKGSKSLFHPVSYTHLTLPTR